MNSAVEELRRLGDELAADGWRPWAKVLWRRADQLEEAEKKRLEQFCTHDCEKDHIHTSESGVSWLRRKVPFERRVRRGKNA